MRSTTTIHRTLARTTPPQRPLLQWAAGLAALSLGLGAASVWAQETGGKTRPEVKAETRAAIQRGEVSSRGDATSPEREARPAKSDVPRAAVKADTKAAIARGERTLSAEGSPSEKLPRTSTQARADVKADARSANKTGQNRVGESYPDRKP